MSTRIARLKIGRRGIAALEFALLAPVFVTLLLSSADVANRVQTSLRLEGATRAGAQYAAANASDMGAIRNRVIAAWPELTLADVPLPTLACECAATPVACYVQCQGGLVQTITVTAQRNLTPFLLQTMAQGQGSAVIRLR